jgi:hypothetical protein
MQCIYQMSGSLTKRSAAEGAGLLSQPNRRVVTFQKKKFRVPFLSSNGKKIGHILNTGGGHRKPFI